MPVFTTDTPLACPPERVWDFLIRPANLVLISPPDLNLQLVDGPEVLHLGARVAVAGRRWGIAQRIVTEVTLWEPGVCFRDEQREGPLRKFVHTQRLKQAAGGTTLRDEIEFEPPGGMLGFLVTARRVEQELAAMFEHRARRMQELLEARST